MNVSLTLISSPSSLSPSLAIYSSSSELVVLLFPIQNLVLTKTVQLYPVHTSCFEANIVTLLLRKTAKTKSRNSKTM